MISEPREKEEEEDIVFSMGKKERPITYHQNKEGEERFGIRIIIRKKNCAMTKQTKLLYFEDGRKIQNTRTRGYIKYIYISNAIFLHTHKHTPL